jgi:hypothetical protein
MNQEKLQDLRKLLLDLHKSLLEWQQREYEAEHQKITSRGQLFELVTSHRSFAWLRQLSELIVGMDTMLESKDPVPEENLKSFLLYTQQLLTPVETGNEFAKNYYQAIHKNPGITLLHAKAADLLDF